MSKPDDPSLSAASSPAAPSPSLTHLDENGEARMVDIGEKDDSTRIAVAQSTMRASARTISAIFDSELKKGDALAVARIAGIMGAKKTPELIPLCHPISIGKVEIDIKRTGDTSLRITARVKCTGKTGVEMEALTAAGIAALAIYDMAKSMDREMEISDIRLLEKSGGKSGDFKRKT